MLILFARLFELINSSGITITKEMTTFVFSEAKFSRGNNAALSISSVIEEHNKADTALYVLFL